MCLTGWGALACHAPLGSDLSPVLRLRAAQQSPLRGRAAADPRGAALQRRGQLSGHRSNIAKSRMGCYLNKAGNLEMTK